MQYKYREMGQRNKGQEERVESSFVKATEDKGWGDFKF
jgi:hypothetical protein